MKIWTTLLLLTIASTTTAQNKEEYSSDLTGNYCDTHSPTECEKVLQWIVHRQWNKKNRGSNSNSNVKYKIPVIVHAITQEFLPEVGTVSELSVLKFMHALDKAFRPTPFQFKQPEIWHVRNDTWHQCNDAESFVPLLRRGGRDTLNIFLCDSRLSKRQIKDFPTPKYERINFIGRTTIFPHELDRFDDGIARDGILLRNPESLHLRALPAVQGIRGEIRASSELEVQMALVHQVGHWLGLLHTFEGGCRNRLRFAKLSVATGDGVADTAAAKLPAIQNKGFKSCFKKKKLRPDTCDNKRKGVDPGMDPVHNYMDYNDPNCVEKQGYFSDLQIERMQSLFERHRLGLDPRTAKNELKILDDDELVSICVASVVKECSCRQSCYSRFRDSLQDFLPFDKLGKATDQIFAQCSECETLGSTSECAEDGAYCANGGLRQFGAKLGYLCKKASHISDPDSGALVVDVPCYSDSNCGRREVCDVSLQGCFPEAVKSSQCVTSSDCSSGKACRMSDHVCSKKAFRKLGDPCLVNQDCKSDYCVAGVCSSCRKIGLKKGCKKEKLCRLTESAGGATNAFFSCHRDKSFGAKRCATREECNSHFQVTSDTSAVDCVFGECRECPEIGSIEGCNTENSDASLKFCNRQYRCESQMPEGSPCFTDDECERLLVCANGQCAECAASGATPHCLSQQYCWEDSCEHRRQDGEECFADFQCLSSRCLSGRCYGDCSADDDCGSFTLHLGWIADPSKECIDHFCWPKSATARQVSVAKQQYLQKYDCRTGHMKSVCRVCVAEADWQCSDNQFCTKSGFCAAKKPGGEGCQRHGMCMSGKCDPGKKKCKKRGVECTANLDCKSNEFCDGFKCAEKRRTGLFCTEHFQCESQSCDSAGFFCEQCRDDVSCRNGKGGDVCARGFGRGSKCVDCESDSQCPINQACTLSGECIFQECQTDLDCEEGLVCDIVSPLRPMGKFVCVECITHSDCDSNQRPVCAGNNTCVGCLERDEKTIVFDPNQLYCRECYDDSDCKHKPDRKVCKLTGDWSDGAGSCVRCLYGGSNRGCESESEICSLSFVTLQPTCKTSDAECPSGEDNECPGSQVCHNETAPLGPNVCGCREDSDCDGNAKGKFVCDQFWGRCVECDPGRVPSSGCPLDKYCHWSSDGVCIPKECVADGDCPVGKSCFGGGKDVVNFDRPTWCAEACVVDDDCPGSRFCVLDESGDSFCGCFFDSNCDEGATCLRPLNICEIPLFNSFG